MCSVCIIPCFVVRLYYCYETSRVSTCPLTVHTLLHIADSIETMGPVGGYWAFPMERWCGYCSRAIHSRRFPWANIANYVTAAIRLHTIKLCYGIDDELIHSTESVIRSAEKIYEGCEAMFLHLLSFTSLMCCYFVVFTVPNAILMPPNPYLSISTAERNQIARHLRTHHPCLSLAAAVDLIPWRLERWSKFRISGDGDTMHAAMRVPAQPDSRDASFVKVRRSKPRYWQL